MTKARLKNEQVFWIDGQLPGLNEIIAANAEYYTRKGKRFYKWYAMKSKWEKTIGLILLAAKIRPVQSYSLTFTYYEPNRKRDPGNIESGAVKIVEDALQANGIIPTDGQRYRRGCIHLPVKISRTKPGVRVQIFKDGE